jgi:serine/threonine protein kinase
MDPVAGTLVAQRFRLVRELGRGSMGTVWLADHETLGLRCAVKFTTAEAERDPAYRERFEREARAIAQLDCPNVVRVLDYDVFEGVPFLAMECLAGEDLETRIRRVGRLPPADVLRIVTQVAQGLARAHAAGIIHRDLKPGNVFLARDGDREVAKILDFGLAKMAASDGAVAMTQVGSILGTPVYMSPEQARSLGDIDERSDLWSLAVITYECLLGKLPFDGPSLGEVFARIMFEPIPVPSAVDPTVPRAFDRWWERAVCRDVEGRFASAREMVDALGEALGRGDAHSSRSDLASVRTVRPPPRRHRSRPHRSGWLVAAGVATLMIAGAQFLPSGLHVTVPPTVGDHVRSALVVLDDSVSRLAAEADLVMPSITPPESSPGLVSSAVSLPAAPPTRLIGMNPDLPTEAPVAHASSAITTPPAMPSSATGQPSAALDTATPVSEAQGSDLSATGSECRAGQHRCEGRVLQACNDDRDGWTDVTECKADSVCDATGAGGCTPLGVEAPGESR